MRAKWLKIVSNSNGVQFMRRSHRLTHCDIKMYNNLSIELCYNKHLDDRLDRTDRYDLQVYKLIIRSLVICLGGSHV